MKYSKNIIKLVKGKYTSFIDEPEILYSTKKLTNSQWEITIHVEYQNTKSIKKKHKFIVTSLSKPRDMDTTNFKFNNNTYTIVVKMKVNQKNNIYCL
jgi:hypothetical protein